MEPIYFVNVFYLEEGKVREKRHRCWGWFEKEETAERYIKENITDIYENGYYNFALIEQTGPGICNYVVGDELRWFDVEYISSSEYKVTEVDTPERFKQMCGFSYA